MTVGRPLFSFISEPLGNVRLEYFTPRIPFIPAPLRNQAICSLLYTYFVPSVWSWFTASSAINPSVLYPVSLYQAIIMDYSSDRDENKNDQPCCNYKKFKQKYGRKRHKKSCPDKSTESSETKFCSKCHCSFNRKH